MGSIPYSRRSLHISSQKARAVWAYISVPSQTQHTTRTIGARLGMAWSTVHLALLLLRSLGHITYRARSKGGRVIVVPFLLAEVIDG
jgi:hypothetical protein